MSRAISAVKGLAWLVGGRLTSALLSILSTAILARVLTPGDFGLMAAALAILALSNVFFDGLFGINIIRTIDLRQEHMRTTLTVGVMTSLLMMALIVSIAPLAEFFFGFRSLSYILAASSITVLPKAIFSIAGAKLQREGRFKMIAGASLAGQFVGYILVAIPMSLNGLGVWALVAAMIAAGTVEAGIAAISAQIPIRPNFDRQTLKDIHATSLYSLANMLNWIANTSANFVIGKSLGAVELGLYSRGWKLLDLIVSASATPLSKIILPAFSRLRNNDDELRRAFSIVLSLVVTAYAVASALLTLHASGIVYAALGSQWASAVPVAEVLFATLVPRCCFKVSENLAVACGRSSAAATRQGLYAILMLGGSLLGVHYGIIGVSISVSVAITIFYISSMSYSIIISRSSAASILTIHFRAFSLALCVAAVDRGVFALLDPGSGFLPHFFSALSGTFLGVFLVAIWPRFWLGQAGYIVEDFNRRYFLGRRP